ncbi:hypothetical protein HNP84_009481 [Thermocatellispora tengchongensis]|uniref:Uncharacterized protein n=1 Tax=Thermocatellispora tengchongensis TaxID=1073253 RepID=A0A840PRI4_9ACTN|nr:hypothetical protein [Thermocatellispora tengchongensis]MBB5139717.1 hypothetical protein [Thermocatellispora tengchongensis]
MDTPASQWVTSREFGRVAFGPGRIAATDWTSEWKPAKKRTTRVRWLTFPGEVYVHGLFEETGEWLRSASTDRPRFTAGHIDVLDPAVLKAVLATTTTTRPVPGGLTRHDGVITVGALYELDPSLRLGIDLKPNRAERKIKIAWRLWFGKDRLVRRVRATWTEPVDRKIPDQSHRVDLRVTGWGGKVEITRPPADLVREADENGVAPRELPVPLHPVR